MSKYYAGIAAGDTLDGMIANGGDFGITPSQDIDCENIAGVAVTFSGKVNCSGTTDPFYPPRVTTTQRDAMSVTQGAMVFNSTDGKLQVYNGSSWQTLPGMTLGLTVALDG